MLESRHGGHRDRPHTVDVITPGPLGGSPQNRPIGARLTWRDRLFNLVQLPKDVVANAQATELMLTPSSLSLQVLRSTPKSAPHGGSQELAVPLHDKLMPTLSRIERERLPASYSTSGSPPAS
jgi:hypothetical protein